MLYYHHFISNNKLSDIEPVTNLFFHSFFWGIWIRHFIFSKILINFIGSENEINHLEIGNYLIYFQFMILIIWIFVMIIRNFYELYCSKLKELQANFAYANKHNHHWQFYFLTLNFSSSPMYFSGCFASISFLLMLFSIVDYLTQINTDVKLCWFILMIMLWTFFIS